MHRATLNANGCEVREAIWKTIAPFIKSKIFDDVLNETPREVGFRHRPKDFDAYLALSRISSNTAPAVRSEGRYARADNDNGPPKPEAAKPLPVSHEHWHGLVRINSLEQLSALAALSDRKPSHP